MSTPQQIGQAPALGPHPMIPQREPTLYDLMSMIHNLHTCVDVQLDTARRENGALRFEVAELRNELAALRAEVGAAAVQVGTAGQRADVARRAQEDTLEEVQKEVKGMQKKLVGMNTVIRKTASTVDTIHDNTKDIEDEFVGVHKLLITVGSLCA